MRWKKKWIGKGFIKNFSIGPTSIQHWVSYIGRTHLVLLELKPTWYHGYYWQWHNYQALNGLCLMSNTVLSLTSRSGSLHQAKLGKNCLKSIQTKWVGPHLMVHNTNAQWPIENQTVITLRVKLKLFSSTQLRFLRRFQMQDSQVKGEGRPFHLLLML